MSTRFCVVLSSILSLTAAASAQLVTPPTDAPPKTEPLPIPAEEVRPPAPSGIQTFPSINTAPPADAIPADLKWDKLAKYDEAGKLIRLRVPAEAAAIAANPLLNDQVRAAANEYLVERLRTFENLVITNLDIVEDFDSDKLAKLNVRDKEQLGWWTGASAAFKPPAAPAGISVELSKRGVFSSLQAKVNTKIAKEYVDTQYKDTLKATEAVLDRTLATLETVPLLLREQAVSEPLQVRSNLLLEASWHLAAILPSLKLEGEVATKAKGVVAAIAAAKSDADRLAAMESLRTVLTVDQRRAILKQSIALRPAGK
jgi:hypothetical protein